MRSTGRALVVVLLLAALPALLFAQEFKSYPQFRYTAGLPGNGYAVDNKGEAGFQGAMSQCIPLGYTPGNGSYALALNDSTIKGYGITLGNSHGSNGNLMASYGFDIGKHAVCATYNAVDSNLDPSYNVQFEVAKEHDNAPGISVGVMDIMNWRESTLGSPPGDAGARSFYLAATKRFGAEKHPVHVTAGIGTNRFRAPFGGVSWDITRRVKVLTEYDSFCFNAGLAADLTGGRRNPIIVYVGAASLNRPVLGLSVAH